MLSRFEKYTMHAKSLSLSSGRIRIGWFVVKIFFAAQMIILQFFGKGCFGLPKLLNLGYIWMVGKSTKIRF